MIHAASSIHPCCCSKAAVAAGHVWHSASQAASQIILTCCMCRHAQRLKEYGIKLGPRTTGSRSPSRTPRASEVLLQPCVAPPGTNLTFRQHRSSLFAQLWQHAACIWLHWVS